MSENTLCWTDIPVADMDRAIKFYSAVLGKEVSKMSEQGFEYGLLPHEEQNASGCLCVGSDSVGNENKPSQTGPLIYLSVEGRLDDAVKTVGANDGKVLESKTTDRATWLSCPDRRFRRQPHRIAFVHGVSNQSSKTQASTRLRLGRIPPRRASGEISTFNIPNKHSDSVRFE